MMTIKQGETFAFVARLTDDAGQPIIGAAGKLSCAVRGPLSKLVGTMTVTAGAVDGDYNFRYNGDTATWHPGTEYVSDIKYVDNDITIISDTFTITAERSVS